MVLRAGMGFQVEAEAAVKWGAVRENDHVMPLDAKNKIT